MTSKQQAGPLARLSGYRTPIVYDAVERFDLRSRSEGYTDGSVRCILPSLGSFVGYAWTGKIVTRTAPQPDDPGLSWRDVWASLSMVPGPRIAVVQDIDEEPGRGCVWGDVSAAIFQAQGCVAALTNGTVRDLRGVEEIGFGLFASAAVVGHGYGRYVEIGGPVTVGGLRVQPGDLIHADEHGALVIPAGIDLELLLRTIEHVIASERKVIGYCRSPGFDLDELDRLHTWSMETAG